jgi:hypothetical protein
MNSVTDLKAAGAAEKDDEDQRRRRGGGRGGTGRIPSPRAGNFISRVAQWNLVFLPLALISLFFFHSVAPSILSLPLFSVRAINSFSHAPAATNESRSGGGGVGSRMGRECRSR